MRVVPKTVNGKISFYNSRVTKWAEDPAKIGSSPEEIAALQEKLDNAKAAFAAQRQAMNAAQSATLRLNLALDALCNDGACAILRARSKARMDGRSVYSAALIRSPKKPSPIKPPGKPTAFSFKLTQVGQLILKWDCANPRGSQGTMYEVRRQLGNSGPFEFLDITGEKQFTDETLPPGTAVATYEVQAVRSKTKGPVATYPIRLYGSAPTTKMVMAAMRAA